MYRFLCAHCRHAVFADITKTIAGHYHPHGRDVCPFRGKWLAADRVLDFKRGLEQVPAEYRAVQP